MKILILKIKYLTFLLILKKTFDSIDQNIRIKNLIILVFEEYDWICLNHIFSFELSERNK